MKPEFGNLDQIKLLEMEKRYGNMKPIGYIDCPCGCKNCDATLEECPYCEESSIDQFTDGVCRDCNQEAIPHNDWMNMRRLRAAISQGSTTDNNMAKKQSNPNNQALKER